MIIASWTYPVRRTLPNWLPSFYTDEPKHVTDYQYPSMRNIAPAGFLNHRYKTDGSDFSDVLPDRSFNFKSQALFNGSLDSNATDLR